MDCERVEPGLIVSDWELTTGERRLIEAGARVQLAIFMEPIPPVVLTVVPPFCTNCKEEMELGEEAIYACPWCG